MTRLTTAVEDYLTELRRVRATGGATAERSSYGPLANLLNAVGATLKPKTFCVGELADQGAGHPDFGLYAAKQVQKGRPREGQVPERALSRSRPPMTMPGRPPKATKSAAIGRATAWYLLPTPVISSWLVKTPQVARQSWRASGWRITPRILPVCWRPRASSPTR